MILYKENHLKTFIAYVKKPICWGFPTNTLYFLYTNKYLYNQCIKLFYLFYIHHCSIYILDHIRRPFLIKICCSVVRNVSFHEKNVSVKFQWNRFIFRWSAKPLKNEFLFKKTWILNNWVRTMIFIVSKICMIVHFQTQL